MKNRYGADGLTFSSKIDTANGYIEINDQPLTIEDSDNGTGKKHNGDFDAVEKQALKKKFFELQG
jgi:hypothetical protein